MDVSSGCSPWLRAAVLAAGITGFGSAPAIAQAPDLSKVEFRSEKLGENLHALFGAGGNIAVLTGPDGALVVDSDLVELSPKLRAALSLVSENPPRFLINTHFHFDHAGGNATLGRGGTVIVAHDNVRKHLMTRQVVNVGVDIVTEPTPELVERHRQGLKELPVLRESDQSYYLREERQGLIVGPYERHAPAWAVDGVHPGRRALVAMPLALLGLVLALDIVGTLEKMAGRWAEIGAGVAWALGAATTFALTLFLTTKHLKEVDGRMRTLLTMGTTAVIVGLAGGVTGNLALPTDGTGWLGLVLLTVLYGSAITAIFTVVPRLGAATNTTALNFEPIAALALGWVVLGQEMAARQMVGALLVVAAVVLIGSKRH